jgi:hypothetical protein
MDDIEDDVEEDSIVWDDINESLRGALGRLANTAEKMPHLPEGCPFTLAIELRDEASPPIGVGLLPLFHDCCGHRLHKDTRLTQLPHTAPSTMDTYTTKPPTSVQKTVY